MDDSVEDISIADDDAEVMKAKGHAIPGITAAVAQKGGQER